MKRVIERLLNEPLVTRAFIATAAHAVAPSEVDLALVAFDVLLVATARKAVSPVRKGRS